MNGKERGKLRKVAIYVDGCHSVTNEAGHRGLRGHQGTAQRSRKWVVHR